MIQTKSSPTIKTPQQLASMKVACRITARAMQQALDGIKPGMTTADVDDMLHQSILEQGGKPAFLGLYGFPACACISVNDEIVHGIPSKKRFVQDGDLVSIDCGTIFDSMYSDMARTVVVGQSNEVKENLVHSTKDALKAGVEQVKPGNHISDISRTVEKRLKRGKYGIVREYVGHGIGVALHESPQVPNFDNGEKGEVLRVGMVLAIEPMATTGSWRTSVLDDGWTVTTADGSLSAHFEDTVVVTEDGCSVLTQI